MADNPQEHDSQPTEMACEDEQYQVGIQYKAPSFVYRYPPDFPAAQQLAIENARREANREFEKRKIWSFDDYAAAHSAWFWHVVSAAAPAIGKAGTSVGWDANRRREQLWDYGVKAARAADIAGRDDYRFKNLSESAKWLKLDDYLFAEADVENEDANSLVIPADDGVKIAHSDPELDERSKIRSDWLNKKLAQSADWTSDKDIETHSGPVYNTIQRYRSGTKSTRDLYVRKQLTRAFKCPLSEVPE
jgi:hypothetical protein